jgi:threonine/homoserine/homoserine lactone efflux protein
MQQKLASPPNLFIKNNNMFKELYYWMYFYLSKIKTNDTPAFNAGLLISLLQIFNILTFAIIINYFVKADLDIIVSDYVGLTLCAILLIIDYFSLYAQRKIIFEKYGALQPKRKTRGIICFWLYAVLSLVGLFVSGAYLVTPRY